MTMISKCCRNSISASLLPMNQIDMHRLTNFDAVLFDMDGVQAGRAGGLGLVIGVNRENQADALRHQGADIVVTDLAELLPSEPETELFPAPPAKN